MSDGIARLFRKLRADGNYDPELQTNMSDEQHPREPRVTLWSFGDIRIQTPYPMPLERWEKLNAYVQFLKPNPDQIDAPKKDE